MNEQFAQVNGIELCYETFGDSGDPALLLIMGLGTQMLGWHEDFCQELVGRGFFVIRFDNRDVGRSTWFKDSKPPALRELVLQRPKNPPYSLADMADDAVGLLDELGIERAHVVGASMGGMIGQLVAARHPERVLSFSSIMSSTGSRLTGQPAPRVMPAFLAPPGKGREAYVERVTKLFKLVGSTGFEVDEEGLRERAGAMYDRGVSQAAVGRQLGAIIASGSRAEDLKRIKAPTVVIHGSVDKLVRPSGGKATAKLIPDAKLVMVEGMGHDLPRGAWPQILDAIEENTRRAAAPAPVA